MSSVNTPFVFGAAGAGQGQTAPALPSHHQSSTTPNQAQSTQQTAFQQNAQLPGIDMSALAGISPDQVALIARLLQSGALLPPPPPPGASAAPAQLIAPNPPANSTPPQRVTEQKKDDSDKDKEEGEIEDGEMNGTPLSRAPDSLPKDVPTGPRNPTSPSSSRQNALSRPSANANSARRLSSLRNTPSQPLTGAGSGIYMAKEKQSKEFILAMHQAGYSYQQLARMVDDAEPLRHMFQLLGLPVSSDYGLGNGTQPAELSSQAHSANASSRVPVSAPPQKLAATKPPAPPKPAARADRSAYLAKLQALKAGRAGSSGTQPTSEISAPPDSVGGVPSPTAATQHYAAPSAPSAVTSTPTSKAVKTELARQRLEAFKAQRAAKQQGKATLNGVPSASSPLSAPAAASITNAEPQDEPARDGLGAGLNGIAARLSQGSPPVATQDATLAQAAIQPQASSIPATPDGSFTGLPGLFANNFPQQVSPTASQQPPARTVFSTQQNVIPLKRLVGSPSAQPQTKRPFGQSRSASEDESFIIENSDDEDEDARMDADTASATIHARFQSLRNAPTHLDASSKSGFPQSSTPSTPEANTPGGMSYEQRLKAIEELNRRIAEKEAKNKAQGKAMIPKAEAVAASPGLPGIFTPSGSSPVVPPAEEQAASNLTTIATPDRPASAAALKLKQQKEELRQRIVELENARRQAGAKDLPSVPGELSTSKLDPVPYAPRSPAGLQSAAIESDRKNPTESITAPISAASIEKEAAEGSELDDESDFDFYADEEPANALKPSGGHEHVGLQATNVSVATDADIFPEDQPHESITNPALSHLMSSEAETRDQMAADVSLELRNVAQDPDPTVEEAIPENLPQSTPQAVPVTGEQHSESIQVQPTPPDSDAEMEGSESESGDSGDDERSVLNGPFELAENTHANNEGHDLDRLFGTVNDDNGPGMTIDKPEIDDVDSSDASSTKSSESDEYEPELANVQDEDTFITQASAADDDLAPELQPGIEQQATTEPSDELPADHTKAYYTPYESIMTKFKDYRYHPQYLEAVPSGFKSRTYNHRIDPNKQLCPIEAQGDTCTDNGCQGQHFDKMVISDNMLLQQMGMRNTPARTKEEVVKWGTGLQELIKTLKAAGVRDAETIAASIAQYRREFIGDPTKVISIR